MKLLYTGIKRSIGSPADYQQNKTNNTFGNNFDLTIPLEETDQSRKSGNAPPRLDDINSHFTNMQVKSPINGQPQRMDQQRTMAGGSNYHQKEEKIDVANDEYCPLALLNNMINDWVIRVKVAKKYPIRNYQNARGSGSILNIDLIDKNMTQI